MANNAHMKFNEWAKQRGRSMAIARLLDVTQPVVSDWVKGKKSIPAHHCKAIEKFSGGEVTCIEMRPDDWHKYWPELAAPQPHQAPTAIKTDSPAHQRPDVIRPVLRGPVAQPTPQEA